MTTYTLTYTPLNLLFQATTLSDLEAQIMGVQSFGSYPAVAWDADEMGVETFDGRAYVDDPEQSVWPDENGASFAPVMPADWAMEFLAWSLDLPQVDGDYDTRDMTLTIG